MWVFCGGMFRSASTLQYQLCARILEDAGRGMRAGWVSPDGFPELRDRLAPDSRWKVVKSHWCGPDVQEQFRHDGTLGLYSYRDLRDVIVSMMRKENRSFAPEWVRQLLQGCIMRDCAWRVLPRVLLSRYEDFTVDLPTEVARIAAHLGIEFSHAACRELAREFSLESQRERIEQSARRGGMQRDQKSGQEFDRWTLLHRNHIKNGEIGSWRTALSDGEVGCIEAVAGEWLVARGYALSSGSSVA